MSLEEIIVSILLRYLKHLAMPSWASKILIAVLVLLFLYLVIATLVEKWKTIFAPIFYNKENQQRAKDRTLFAMSVLREIDRLNEQQQWEDNQFTELEADIELGGRWRPKGLFRFLKRTQTGLRREKSLSRAIESSRERLILLEGEPGAGKSVALRHISYQFVSKSSKSKSTHSLIPIYVNLRELTRSGGKDIDRELIYAFVLKFINRINAPDIKEYLSKEFDRGTKENTWLFLFDSFDEIPEILSSVDADETIRKYSDAIADFMSGMNQCRCVLASRYFRGPSKKGWTSFRILELSEDRQIELIKKSDLTPDKKKELIGGLPVTTQEIKNMSSNPMFLSLLCEHVRTGNGLPANGHLVFESFVDSRLNRDKERLKKRFGLNPIDVRIAGENIAFCMTADSEIGLSPKLEQLTQAMKRQGISINNRLDEVVEALSYIRLARLEPVPSVEKIDTYSFEFFHRRFQEYFATCFIIKHSNVIEPKEMLLNARWRESCITLLQTQEETKIQPILSQAHILLLSKIDQKNDQNRQEEIADDKNNHFHWPIGFLHILGVLQEGLSSRIHVIPTDLLEMVGNYLLTNAWQNGILLDKKWALEVSRISDENVFLKLIELALNSKSQWLRNIAYRQLSRVGNANADVEKWIFEMLLELINSGRYAKTQFATYSFLARLPRSKFFLEIHRQLMLANIIDRIFFLFLFFSSSFTLIVMLILHSWSFNFLATLSIEAGIVFLTLFPLSVWSNLIYWSKWDWRSRTIIPLYRYFIGANIFVAFMVSLFSGIGLFSIFIITYAYLLMWTPSLLFMLKYTGKYHNSKDSWSIPLRLPIEYVKPFLRKIQISRVIESFRPYPKKIRMSGIIESIQKLLVFIALFSGLGFIVYLIWQNSTAIALWFTESKASLLVFITYGFYILIGSFIIFSLFYLGRISVSVYKNIRGAPYIHQSKSFKEFLKDAFRDSWKDLIAYIKTYPQLVVTVLEQIPFIERRKFTRWKANANQKINSFELIDRLIYFDFRLSNQALEFITTQGLLQPTLESEYAIRQLIIHTENIKTQNLIYFRELKNYLADTPTEFKTRFENSRKNRVFLINAAYDFDFIDKLNQLLEGLYNDLGSPHREKQV